MEKIMDYKEKIRHGTPGFPFKIYENIFDNGLNLYTHYHKEFEILWIKSGKGTAHIDNKSYSVKDGDILFINSGQLHGIVGAKKEKSIFIALVFSPDFLGKFDDIAGKYIVPVMNNAISIPAYMEDNEEMLRLISALCNVECEEFYELKVKRCMFEIWEYLISKSQKHSGMMTDSKIDEIKSIIDYINKNYQKKITLSDLAELTHMSKIHVCRKFTELSGISPINYLINVRIERSCILLKETGMSIGDIAMECGFSGFSYYSEIFRKIMGCSPKEYRNKVTKKL